MVSYKKRKRIWILSLLLIVFFCNNFAQVYIEKCDTQLLTGTEYKLAKNVDATTRCLLIMGVSDVVVDCDGKEIVGSEKFAGIEISRSKNVVIKNCIVKNFTFGIYVVESENIRIENSEVKNSRYGILLSYAHNNVLYNLKISNLSYSGVELYYSDNNKISFLNIEDSMRYCIDAISSNGNLLSHSTLKNCRTYGVYLDDSRYNTIESIKSLNNRYGVSLVSSSNNEVKNIESNDNSYAGVELYLRSNNNNLTNIRTINNGEYGVHIYSSEGNTIDSVITRGNVQGLTLSGGSSSNKISNVDSFENKYVGIQLYSNSNGNRVSKVNSSNNREANVLIDSSDDNVLDYIDSYYSKFGIKLVKSNRNKINNVETTSSNYGIALVSSSGNELIDVKALRNTYAGIELYSGSEHNLLKKIVVMENQYGMNLVFSSKNTIMNVNSYKNKCSINVIESVNSFTDIIIPPDEEIYCRPQEVKINFELLKCEEEECKYYSEVMVTAKNDIILNLLFSPFLKIINLSNAKVLDKFGKSYDYSITKDVSGRDSGIYLKEGVENLLVEAPSKVKIFRSTISDQDKINKVIYSLSSEEEVEVPSIMLQLPPEVISYGKKIKSIKYKIDGKEIIIKDYSVVGDYILINEKLSLK